MNKTINICYQHKVLYNKYFSAILLIILSHLCSGLSFHPLTSEAHLNSNKKEEYEVLLHHSCCGVFKGLRLQTVVNPYISEVITHINNIRIPQLPDTHPHNTRNKVTYTIACPHITSKR